jgi:hypothetical protein
MDLKNIITKITNWVSRNGYFIKWIAAECYAK